ncbi:MAG: Lrp/AsnC family transcriptional regulator [Mogibacterium sp.]|nr:Lrp/AsnC family transcriptional regulator [Mogibacterium sp.]MBR2539377.1 Lrp/AsnC family transcriptional regulator [Mogibacterium sp.]
MDNIDIKLIRHLAEDASQTASSLVSKLNLSVPAINKRIAKLREEGIIRKETILTDSRKVGKSVTAYLLIVLEHFDTSDELLKIVEADPDILECYAISGEYDYILKVCAESIDALEDKLLVMKKKGIAKSNTMFTLREYKFEPTALPDNKEE